MISPTVQQSYDQTSLLSVTAKLLERLVSTLKSAFLLLSFSSESTATMFSPPPLCRNSSGQGHRWTPCWLPQLLTQPCVCHLLCLWDLSPNFLFVKCSAYHKWKEGDFTHVLPNFDNASYPAPLFYTIKFFFLVNLFLFLLGSRGWDGEYLCIYNKNLWNKSIQWTFILHSMKMTFIYMEWKNGLSFYNESVKFSSLHIQRGALATIQ